MTSRPAARPTAPGSPVPRTRSHQTPLVQAYLHRDSGAAWLDVAGPLSPPANLRRLLGELRRAHRRIPRGIDRVGVDLTRLDELTVELAVVLSLESRMLSVRNIGLAVAVLDTVVMSPGVQVMLERLEVWRLDEDGLTELSQAAADARRGANGWGTCPVERYRPADVTF